jgi:hypothetical protein
MYLLLCGAAGLEEDEGGDEDVSEEGGGGPRGHGDLGVGAAAAPNLMSVLYI